MKRHGKRQGFTLIEILVAVTAGSWLMLMAVTLVHTAFTLQAESQNRFEQAITLNRFLEQFRRDGEGATRIVARPDRAAAFETIAHRLILYSSSGNVLTRELSGNPDTAGQPPHIEKVTLPHDCEAIWTVSLAEQTMTLEVRQVQQTQALDGSSGRLLRRVVVAGQRLPIDILPDIKPSSADVDASEEL